MWNYHFYMEQIICQISLEISLQGLTDTSCDHVVIAPERYRSLTLNCQSRGSNRRFDWMLDKSKC